MADDRSILVRAYLKSVPMISRDAFLCGVPTSYGCLALERRPQPVSQLLGI
jgi:hypothetical protein